MYYFCQMSQSRRECEWIQVDCDSCSGASLHIASYDTRNVWSTVDGGGKSACWWALELGDGQRESRRLFSPLARLWDTPQWKGQRGGRGGSSREAERRRRGGKETVSPGKPHGFCQDVSLWLPSPTSAGRAEHEYLPTFLTTGTDWFCPDIWQCDHPAARCPSCTEYPPGRYISPTSSCQLPIHVSTVID